MGSGKGKGDGAEGVSAPLLVERADHGTGNVDVDASGRREHPGQGARQEQLELRGQGGSAPARAPRIVSLDTFRGLAVFGMLLVDNQGSLPISDPEHIIWPVRESEWNGSFCASRWTCAVPTADLIFPAFLFAMGVSCAIALEPRQFARLPKVLRRAALLFIIGFCFALVGSNFHPRVTQLCGVLHRLGICYLGAALVRLSGLRTLKRLAVVVGLVAVYCVAQFGFFPAACRPLRDDGSRATLDLYRDPAPSCNAEERLDAMIFRTGGGVTISEGAISTLTAMALTLIGLEFGLPLARARKEARERRTSPEAATLNGSAQGPAPRSGPALARNIAALWAAAAAAALAVAWALAVLVPANKKLFTPSFLALTVAASGFASAALLAGLDGTAGPVARLARTAARPAIVLGRNPLAVFLGMIALETVLLDNITVPRHSLGPHGLADVGPGTPYEHMRSSAWLYIYYRGFVSWISDRRAASLVVSLVHSAIWMTMAWILDVKKIYIRL